MADRVNVAASGEIRVAEGNPPEDAARRTQRSCGHRGNAERRLAILETGPGARLARELARGLNVRHDSDVEPKRNPTAVQSGIRHAALLGERCR